LTRIQLNLLGRRTYLASVVSLASPQKASEKIQLENRDDDGFEQTYGNDFETNRKYLSFSWWLLHRGCKDVMDKVVSTVKDVFGPVNPREDITLARLSELTLEVRRRIEGATEEDRRYHQHSRMSSKYLCL
jgi:peroxin-3